MASEDNKFYSKLCRALTDCLRACGPEWTQESFFVCARYTNDYSYYHGLEDTLFTGNHPREDLHEELSGRSTEERMVFSYELGKSVQAIDWISNIIKVEHHLPHDTYQRLNKFSEAFSKKNIHHIFSKDYETFSRLGKNILPLLFDALESIRFYDSILANTAGYQEVKFRSEPASEDALKSRLEGDALFNYGYRCEKILFPTDTRHPPTQGDQVRRITNGLYPILQY